MASQTAWRTRVSWPVLHYSECLLVTIPDFFWLILFWVFIRQRVWGRYGSHCDGPSQTVGLYLYHVFFSLLLVFIYLFAYLCVFMYLYTCTYTNKPGHRGGPFGNPFSPSTLRILEIKLISSALVTSFFTIWAILHKLVSSLFWLKKDKLHRMVT